MDAIEKNEGFWDSFEEHFFDVRKHKPKAGQIIACYRASADFVEISPENSMKRDIIGLLKMNKAVPATQLMRKFHGATDKDAVKVCREIVEDLLAGMSEEEVALKSHEMVIEHFFYTDKENVPLDDPHWTTISVRNVEEILDTLEEDEEGEFRVKSHWVTGEGQTSE